MTADLKQLNPTNMMALAESYRKEGYQVIFKLGDKYSHEVISSDNFDLIVHAEEDSVFVAIKTHNSAPETEYLSEPKPQKLASDSQRRYDYPNRDPYDIQIYLARALEIVEMGAPDYAVSSAILSAEAVMRMVAENHAIDFELQMPCELAKTFLDLGLINQEDYQVLVTGIELRDRTIYKGEKVTVDPKFACQAVAVVKRLLTHAGAEEEI